MPLNDTPKVTVCIPLYNKSTETVGFSVQAIKSLSHSKMPLEVLVIDNDSPAHWSFRGDERDKVLDALEALKTASSHQHTYMYALWCQNRGFGPAVNFAAQVATGEYFCQMNSDCELVEDSISILVEALEKYDLSVAMPEHYENCKHYGLDKSDELMGPDWKFGAFWLTYTSLFRAVRGFDERFKLCYWEDTDLWRRIESTGALVRGVRNTWVKHVGGASSLPNRDALFLQNEALFKEKWG